MADTQVPVKEFEYDQFVHAALESEEQVKQEEFIKRGTGDAGRIYKDV